MFLRFYIFTFLRFYVFTFLHFYIFTFLCKPLPPKCSLGLYELTVRLRCPLFFSHLCLPPTHHPSFPERN